MSQIDELKNVPEISFFDKSLESIRDEMLSDYVAQMERETGTAPDVTAADPMRLIINAAALQIKTLGNAINAAGRGNFLKYAVGADLENLGALKGVERAEASPAKTILRFQMNDARTSVTGIPGGTRAATNEQVFFATDEYAEIPAGETYIDVPATAIVAGEQANSCVAGTINKIVDPVPYISSVTNTITASGGTDKESDDSLTRRIYLAPASYSVAGPAKAYEYHVNRSRSDIGDVFIDSPSAGTVRVLFTLSDGSLPSESDIAEMSEYLSGDTIRPLTDNVVVGKPTETEYTITMTYYISKSNSAQAASIQAAVVSAVEKYKSWQRKIGRDIIPSELIRAVMAAGARRVELTAPTYTATNAAAIPKCNAANVTYGGLEDD